MASAFRASNRELFFDLFVKGEDVNPHGLYHPPPTLTPTPAPTTTPNSTQAKVTSLRLDEGASSSFVAYVGGSSDGHVSSTSTGAVITPHHSHHHQQQQHHHHHPFVLREETWTSSNSENLHEPTSMDVVPFVAALPPPHRSPANDDISLYHPSKHHHQQQHQLQLVGNSGGMELIANRLNESILNPISCRDCGNQAKKDCTHQRCRTCCRSRGLPCSTHVKSTWVPASKRRDRRMALAAIGIVRPKLASYSGGSLKRARSGGSIPGQQSAPLLNHIPIEATATTETDCTSPLVSPRGSEINSGNHSLLLASSSSDALPSQDECSTAKLNGRGWPQEIRTQAVFKCVRVTGLDDEQMEYAYQVSVKIGGHVFKGVLYDQGMDARPSASNKTDHAQFGGNSISTSTQNSVEIYGSHANDLREGGNGL